VDFWLGVGAANAAHHAAARCCINNVGHGI
jgi:hypothetical protein